VAYIGLILGRRGRGLEPLPLLMSIETYKTPAMIGCKGRHIMHPPNYAPVFVVDFRGNLAVLN